MPCFNVANIFVNSVPDVIVDLLRNSIATPSLVAAIMNAKYTNAIPLYRIAQDFEQNDMILSRATMANWVIRCAERYLSLVYDRQVHGNRLCLL